MPRLTEAQEKAIDGLVSLIQSRYRGASFLTVEPDAEVPEAALVVQMLVPGDEALHLELMDVAGGYALEALIQHGVLLSLQLVRPEWQDLR